MGNLMRESAEDPPIHQQVRTDYRGGGKVGYNVMAQVGNLLWVKNRTTEEHTVVLADEFLRNTVLSESCIHDGTT